MSGFPIIVTLLAGAAVVLAATAFRPSVLLRWYLREVRGVKVPEDPGEEIVTYPLA